MPWILLSFLGLIIVILTIRYYYYNLHKDIETKKYRGLTFILLIIIAVVSESSLLYLGLLLILFGLVKATGLL